MKVLTNSEGKVLLSGSTVFKADSTTDPNLIPGNIKKDVDILGVVGTLEAGGPSIEVTPIEMDRIGTVTAPSGSAYNPVTCIPNIKPNGPYCVDEDGYFVKPEAWDDILSVTCENNEVCLLYDNTKELSWVQVNTTLNNTAGYLTYDVGRIVNGQFVIKDTYQVKHNVSFNHMLSDEYPDDDYIVVRIKPTTSSHNIVNIAKGSTFTYNGQSMSNTQQPLLVFNANIPEATGMSIVTLMSIHYVRVKNFTKATAVNTLFSGCYSLVNAEFIDCSFRLSRDCNRMFYGCYNLTRIIANNMKDWISSTCTNIYGMFYSCYVLRGDIDVSNWDTSNVTAAYQLFYICRSLTKVIGIENLNLRNCNNAAASSIFQDCNSLYQDDGVLDLSNWHFYENYTGSVDLTFATCFQGLYGIKEINISTWNMNKAKAVSNMFNECFSLETVSLPQNIGSTVSSAGLDVSTMFQRCQNLTSLDLTCLASANVNKWTNITTYCTSITEVIMPTTVGTLTQSNNSTLTTPFAYCYRLTSLDLSCIDVSKYTYATTAARHWSAMLSSNQFLTDLIPPINIDHEFNVSGCPYLSKESILRIFNNLTVITSTGWYVNLGAVNLAKLSAEEKAIATDKGWNLK